MRKFLVIFVFGMILSGCASAKPQFQWTSDTGKKCFYTCKSNHATCYSRCFDIYGLAACDKAEKYCMLACPDLVEVTDKP
jgi:hypothetical protein